MVFARNKWIGPIVENARAGYVAPIWSPCIVAETSRLLAWLFLKRHADPFSRCGQRELSDAAKRWFAFVSEVFRVVDDHPPYEPQWTASPRDDWDQPVWTAAVRGRALVVVTENLDDGPPKNADGVREYQGLGYLHPEEFLRVVDLDVDRVLGPRLPLLVEPAATEAALEKSPTSAAREEPSEQTEATQVTERVRQEIREILRHHDWGEAEAEQGHGEPPVG